MDLEYPPTTAAVKLPLLTYTIVEADADEEPAVAVIITSYFLSTPNVCEGKEKVVGSRLAELRDESSPSRLTVHL